MKVSKCVSVLFLLALAPSAAGQDSHYWTSQFGNRARLLSGAVIGGVRDLSAVYYNPGALVLKDSPDLLLSGNVFAYSRLTASDALGPGRDLLSTRFSLRPSLFAGEIRIDAEAAGRSSSSTPPRSRPVRRL